MGDLADTASFQSEAAAILQEVSRGGANDIQSLCSERGMSSLNTLLKNSQLDVAYPTACCLREVFKRVELFGHSCEDVIITMVGKVTASASAFRVREALVDALEAYLANFDKRFSPMSSKIENALVNGLCVNEKVCEGRIQNAVERIRCSLEP